MENPMGGLLLMMAEMMDKDDIVKMFEEKIANYKQGKLLVKSEKEMYDLFNDFGLPGILLNSKLAMIANKQGAMELIQEVDKLKKVSDILDVDKKEKQQ